MSRRGQVGCNKVGPMATALQTAIPWRELGAAVRSTLAGDTCSTTNTSTTAATTTSRTKTTTTTTTAAVKRSDLVAILDLNGVLLERLGPEPKHRAARAAALACRPHAHTLDGRKVWLRPHHADLIDYLSRRCAAVGVWSSATARTVDGLLDIVLKDSCLRREGLAFIRDRSYCPPDRASGPFATIKPLHTLWRDEQYACDRFTPANTVILDDTPSKARQNPGSAVIVPLYSAENMTIDYNHDETLLWTAMYFELLQMQDFRVENDAHGNDDPCGDDHHHGDTDVSHQDQCNHKENVQPLGRVPDVRTRLRQVGDLSDFIAAGQLAAIAQTGRPSVQAFIGMSDLEQPGSPASLETAVPSDTPLEVPLPSLYELGSALSATQRKNAKRAERKRAAKDRHLVSPELVANSLNPVP